MLGLAEKREWMANRFATYGAGLDRMLVSIDRWFDRFRPPELTLEQYKGGLGGVAADREVVEKIEEAIRDEKTLLRVLRVRRKWAYIGIVIMLGLAAVSIADVVMGKYGSLSDVSVFLRVLAGVYLLAITFRSSVSWHPLKISSASGFVFHVPESEIYAKNGVEEVEGADSVPFLFALVPFPLMLLGLGILQGNARDDVAAIRAGRFGGAAGLGMFGVLLLFVVGFGIGMCSMQTLTIKAHLRKRRAREAAEIGEPL